MRARQVLDRIAHLGGQIANRGDECLPDLDSSIGELADISPLGGSGPGSIAFFFNPEFKEELVQARPSVLITAPPFLGPISKSGLPIWKDALVISCSDPYLAMALLSREFDREPQAEKTQATTQVHPSAVVAKDVVLGQGVFVGPGVVIEAGARIGDRTRLVAQVYVGREVAVGPDCAFFSQVSVYDRTQIGARVRLHSGVRIGADGFGYAPVRDQGQTVDHQKIYHLGRVVLGDDVEIGANSCVDRGTFGDTVIGSKTKIDNLVQVGHNCQLGEGTIVCGQAGFAGRASTGKFVTVGGHSGITNGVHAGDHSQLAAYSGLTRDLPPGEIGFGLPARFGKTEGIKFQSFLYRLYVNSKRSKGQSAPGENS
jgi:UDP-3-O-[3-hydroxymyristoyl] glucosamine N-acyltransferase